MSFEERLITHIRKKTGNPNADLWTLKFNENDANAKLSDFSSPYFNGLKIRTQEEVNKDYKKIFN